MPQQNKSLFGRHAAKPSRARKPVTIRDLLRAQGVTKEEDMRVHLEIISQTLKMSPNLDISRYKVNTLNKGQCYEG